jgi:ubiquinone/menaquinone biosynthesis C-methylase UbiE
MDPETARHFVHQMFEQTASRYVARIDPAFKPLAEDLVANAEMTPTERVLDLGTGSGLAAIAAGFEARWVVGLDYSGQLLEQARLKLTKPRPGNVNLVQGDMHALCFASESFDVVLGAFSFNSTDPARVFPEALRVLAPGGRLVMQEWGSDDEPSEIVREVVADYIIDDPPPPLAALREAFSTPDAWDKLEGIEDLVQMLEQVGFQEVITLQERRPIRFENIDAFLGYKLAWASRHEEVEAMPDEIRDLFFGELHEQLEPYCAKDSSMMWEPEIVRVKGLKPT